MIKGRIYANDAKQRKYVKGEDDFSSPTASLEAMLATLIIDTMEGRHVSISDIVGAYLHAIMPPEKKILMKFTDDFVDIMCEVNEDYR